MWKEEAFRKLKEARYKLTPQRLKLVEIIEELGPKHPSLREVHEAVRSNFPTLSFSTLYSNVLVLRDLGLLDLLHLGSETRIEVNTKPHLNIIEGDKVRDLEDPGLLAEIEARVGKNVKFVNVILRGNSPVKHEPGKE